MGTLKESKSVDFVLAMIRSNPDLKNEITRFEKAVRDLCAGPTRDSNEELDTLQEKRTRSFKSLRAGVCAEFPAFKQEYIDAAIGRIETSAVVGEERNKDQFAPERDKDAHPRVSSAVGEERNKDQFAPERDKDAHPRVPDANRLGSVRKPGRHPIKSR